MDYCDDNYISCSLIYLLSIIPLTLGIVIIVRHRWHYKRVIQSLKEDPLLDYTMYLSILQRNKSDQKNIPTYAKYLGVCFCFASLIIVSFVMVTCTLNQICLWDVDFVLLELIDTMIWIISGALFYLDHHQEHAFSKKLRIMLGTILAVQVLTMIVFTVERKLEAEDTNKETDKEVQYLYDEGVGYLFNFIFMAAINVISIFFPTFHYVRDYKIEQYDNIINKERYIITKEEQKVTSPQKQISPQNQKKQKLPSFLEALSEDNEQSMQKYDQFVTPTPQEDEPEIVVPIKVSEEQKAREYEEIKQEFERIHKQLDAKIQHNVPQEVVQKPQPEPVKIKIPESTPTPRYEYEYIRVDGFEEMKKQGKRSIYFKIIYRSLILGREVKTERTLREFQALIPKLQIKYPQYVFPPLPEKTEQRLQTKDLNIRANQLQEVLQFIVKNELESKEFTEFLSESFNAKSSLISESNEQKDLSEILGNNDYKEIMAAGATNNVSMQKMIESISFVDDDQPLFPGLRSQSILEQNNLQQLKQQQAEKQVEQKIEKSQAQKKEQSIAFYIRKFEIANNTTVYQYIIQYYRLDTEVNGDIKSQVLKRYNDFKELHKKISGIIKYDLPDQGKKGQNTAEYRKDALQDYLNQCYQNPEIKVLPVFKEFVGL